MFAMLASPMVPESVEESKSSVNPAPVEPPVSVPTEVSDDERIEEPSTDAVSTSTPFMRNELPLLSDTFPPNVLVALLPLIVVVAVEPTAR